MEWCISRKSSRDALERISTTLSKIPSSTELGKLICSYFGISDDRASPRADIFEMPEIGKMGYGVSQIAFYSSQHRAVF